MRVCLVCVEIFAWGKYGGFGRATRKIGLELARRGVEVTAVVPRRLDQKPVEMLDGIKVLSFLPKDLFSSGKLYRLADADIYHSEEPSFGSYLAMRAMPGRKHAVTLRDTRDLNDWRIELFLPSLSRLQVARNFLYEENPLVWQTVRRANARFVAAGLLAAKAAKKYWLASEPPHLPTPVDIPDCCEKAAEPTVCYISRLDRRKRPELFFELAPKFPKVRFVVAGKSRDPEYGDHLREVYGGMPNLEFVEFLDQFENNELSNLLDKSWIMVNTAAREGLPTAFIEACAHRCAVLSAVNPDGFASDFGFHAATDNFAEGLEALIRENYWQQAGQRGYEYVRGVYETQSAIDQHLQAYQELLDSR